MEKEGGTLQERDMIGKMKEYVTVQVGSTADDGQGGGVVTWSTLSGEWAEATMLSYSRVLSEAGVKFRIAVEFKMRYCSTHILSGEHRIVWNGDPYTVHSVVNNNDKLTVLAYR